MTKSDPHSRAALRLCEGLLHLLIEKGFLNSEEVAEFIEEAIDLESETAKSEADAADSRAVIGLLTTLVISIKAK